MGKKTPACKMRAARSREVGVIDTGWSVSGAEKNWYNLDLELNPASA